MTQGLDRQAGGEVMDDENPIQRIKRLEREAETALLAYMRAALEVREEFATFSDKEMTDRPMWAWGIPGEYASDRCIEHGAAALRALKEPVNW